jgi:hypothetical protein
MDQDQKLPAGQHITDDQICAMAESAGFAYISIDETDLCSDVNADISIKAQVISFARALLALK